MLHAVKVNVTTTLPSRVELSISRTFNIVEGWIAQFVAFFWELTQEYGGSRLTVTAQEIDENGAVVEGKDSVLSIQAVMRSMGA